MANTRGIRAGRAFVELGVSDKLSAGLRRAQKRLQAFGSAVTGIGLRMAAIAGTAVSAIAVPTIKAASDAQETLSRFEAVFADQADAAKQFAQTLADSVGRSKYEILDALSTFQSFFAGLGFDPAQARQMSQTLQSLALDFASFHNLSDQEAIDRFISALSGSGEVLDRFGVNIRQVALEQELLKMGISKTWGEVTEQEKALARLNVIMGTMGRQGATGDAVKTAGSFANQMKRLKGEVKDAAVTIGTALIPVVSPVVAWMGRAAEVAGEWIAKNQRLVATAFKVGVAVAAAGAALVVVGTAIVGLGAVFGSLAAIAGGVATAIGVVGAAAAALVSPIGIAVTAVLGLGTALLVSTGAGGEALSWLGDQFKRLRDRVASVMGGITDALAAGDVALAAEILWLSLKLVWQKGVASLERVWLAARNFFVTTVHKMWFGAVAAAQLGFHGLEVAWIETTAFLSKTWTRFTSGFKKIWEGATSFVAKRMLEIQGLFDESLDVEAAKQAVDDQLASRLAELDQSAQQDLADRESRRQRERDDAAEMNEATLAEIGRQFEEAQRSLREGSQAQIEETQRALEEARKKLDDAIAEARRKREASDAEDAGPGRTPADLMTEFESRIASLGETVAKGISVRGTFSAAAVAGLASSGTAAERTAKASEQTARNTKQLADAARNGGLAFA